MKEESRASWQQWGFAALPMRVRDVLQLVESEGKAWWSRQGLISGWQSPSPGQWAWVMDLSKQGCYDNHHLCFFFFKSLVISFAIYLTQNYTISMEALLLFLSWILDCWCSSGKSEICSVAFTELGKHEHFIFTHPGMGVTTKTMSDSVFHWKWPNKLNPLLGDYGQYVDCHFIKHTFTNDT